MNAVRLAETGQPLVVSEMEIPAPADSEVLVRVAAAGICHSDCHYRAGTSPTRPLPLTPGHEVAGVVEQVGEGVDGVSPGDRVALHYLVTCGECDYCRGGHEQFCAAAQMLGKHRDGGYAEYICVPARNAIAVPDAVPMETAAIMMCSTATSLHALEKARIAPDESVAVFGAGGLGLSAIQLATILGAQRVFAVDISAERLEIASQLGATPIDASDCDPVDAIFDLTSGHGVDVSLELIGLAKTMRQAVRVLGVLGRAALVGLTQTSFAVDSYEELINKEAEVIGVSDHLATDLSRLMNWAAESKLDFSHIITDRVALEADAINAVLDRLDACGSGVRSVIVPDGA